MQKQLKRKPASLNLSGTFHTEQIEVRQRKSCPPTIHQPEVSPSMDSNRPSSSSSSSAETDETSVTTASSTAPPSPTIPPLEPWKYLLPNVPSTREFDDLTMYVALSQAVQSVIRSPFAPCSLDTDAPPQSRHEPIQELPKLFGSVCVCDPSTKGNSIRLRSKHFVIGPRGLKLGRREFLNLPAAAQEPGSLNLTCRSGSDGRPQFVLEYTTRLVDFAGGDAREILASQVDVTDAVSALAAALADSERRSYKMEVPVDWVSVADEPSPEPAMHDENESFPRGALAAFRKTIQDIHRMHRDCFIMVQSSGKDAWNVSDTSSSFCKVTKSDTSAFSLADSGLLEKLQKPLSTKRAPFEMAVKTGGEREIRWLYCVPMYQTEMECWMSFLVDGRVGGSWCKG